MSKRNAIRIGLLFSTTGPLRHDRLRMRNGSILAVDEINADPAFPLALEVIEANPGGRNTNYAEMACRMLTTERLVHVVGCYTSSSRKEVLPYFEKYDGLLWYPSHYEGFERSEHVIYTGAAPNQHIVRLAEYLLKHCGTHAYCIGSMLHLDVGKQQDNARGSVWRQRSGSRRTLFSGRRTRL